MLATTDLHMHLTAWNYFGDEPSAQGGFTRLAHHIGTIRKSVEQKGGDLLLLDNGDSLQGTVLGDVSLDTVADGQPHPLMTAFARLEYDAIGLGNHDFDIGMSSLEKVLEVAAFPVLCTNLERLQDNVLPKVQTQTTLTIGPDEAPIRVGLLSVLPPQTALWNNERVAGRVAFQDMLMSLEAGLANLRQTDCDLVVVMAHCGFGDDPAAPGQENVAESIARLPGVDAVFAGHTHLPFAGTVDGDQTPIALAGWAGLQLARIDLDLIRTDGGAWEVRERSVALIDVEDGPEDPLLSDFLQPWHVEARQRMNQTCGRTDARLHSYFSQLHPDAYLHLVAEAQYRVATQYPDKFEGLPLLSAVSPFRAGGRGGPENYTDVPEGPVLRRHIEDLMPFPNAIRAVVLDGVAVRNWLEMAVSPYNAIEADAVDAELLNADWPAHAYDTLFGLSYSVDLRQPARFRPDGTETGATVPRILELTYDGRAVSDQDQFAVLMTDYRANGGGNVPGIKDAPRIALPETRLRDALIEVLSNSGPTLLDPRPWCFATVPGATAVVPTGHAARDVTQDIVDLSPEIVEAQPGNFLQLRIRL
ncbi:MAG: 5'-nucleotidase C-terminal domain-containing protein [Paracoccaceae bacterium]